MINVTNVNPYRIANDYAADIWAEREYWDDLYDAVHQLADGSEHVIYYSKAHDFVRALDSDDEYNAVDACHECDVKPESYDDWAVKIAYFALVNLIMEALNELEENEAA